MQWGQASALKCFSSSPFCCRLCLGLIVGCAESGGAEGSWGGYSWISSEVLIASLLLLGFIRVLNNLGERLAGGNLVAEGRFFRAVLWLSAQDPSCLANCFLLCVLALRSGSPLWETAALCSSSFCVLGGFSVLLILKMAVPSDLLGSVWVHGISLFSQATSGVTSSCPLRAGQMLSLCKQGRHKTSHAANSLKVGKGLSVYLWIWVKYGFFY